MEELPDVEKIMGFRPGAGFQLACTSLMSYSFEAVSAARWQHAALTSDRFD